MSQKYKGTVVGPVSNELFKRCHCEDCLILEIMGNFVEDPKGDLAISTAPIDGPIEP